MPTANDGTDSTYADSERENDSETPSSSVVVEKKKKHRRGLSAAFGIRKKCVWLLCVYIFVLPVFHAHLCVISRVDFMKSLCGLTRHVLRTRGSQNGSKRKGSIVMFCVSLKCVDFMRGFMG